MSRILSEDSTRDISGEERKGERERVRNLQVAKKIERMEKGGKRLIAGGSQPTRWRLTSTRIF